MWAGVGSQYIEDDISGSVPTPRQEITAEETVCKTYSREYSIRPPVPHEHPMATPTLNPPVLAHITQTIVRYD